ncbi:MAG: hypothetical protein PHI12_09590 [Dehalococcoidales bacterium]|nr:hypothetical protein [Dehalococcoidales bacterium]
MKKKLFISMGVAAALVATMALPAMAAEYEETSTPASVSVSSFVSISLTGDISLSGDPGEVLGPDTITVNVLPETNVTVDVGIKGETLDTQIVISDWKWSVDSGTTKTGITGTYVEVAGDIASGGNCVIEHYVDTTGASPGTHNATIYYKAVVANVGF